MQSKEINISSQDEPFEYPKAQMQDQSVGPEQRNQKIILQIQEQQLKRSNRSILSEDIELKLQEVLEDIKEDDGKIFQTVISLRMKELAYSKILVLTYEKSYFRLVQAHFHIGKEYLKFKCYEQAFNHIQTAIEKNIKATESTAHKLYHSYLLTHFGKSLYLIDNYQLALQELTRAINIQSECQQSDKKAVNNVQTLRYLALAKSKLKHEDALDCLKKAAEKVKQMSGEKDRSYGLMLYQQGKHQLQSNNPQQAIKLYQKAIEAIKMSTQQDYEEDIIKIYQQLANIHEHNNPSQFIATLKLKYQTYEDTYGNADKKTIKQQRNLVTALLKYKKVDQSLEECEDIMEKQKKVYGENSLEVGKQLKTIANIYLAKHNYKQAENSFKRALKIFHDLGDQRLAREVKVKLGSLQIQQKQ